MESKYFLARMSSFWNIVREVGLYLVLMFVNTSGVTTGINKSSKILNKISHATVGLLESPTQ